MKATKATRAESLAASIQRARLTYKNQIESQFHLSDLAADLLEEYYLLYWTGAHLKNSLKDGLIAGKYRVIYKGCNPEEAFKSEQVRLSFRTPPREWNLHPVVLVSLRGN